MKLLLADNGKSAYRLRLRADPIPSERYAAEEFRRFFAEISGIYMTFGTGEREILLGYDEYAASLFPNIDMPALGSDGFVIRSNGEKLLIAGGRPRGTMYGVYTFLEKYLGCRWYTSDFSHIPRRAVVELDPIDDLQAPALEYREIFYKDAFDPDWAARNRINGHHQKLDERHGGSVIFYPFVHTFDTLVPQSKYFNEHPEYYSEIDGSRKSGDTQLCLTNPEVLEIAYRAARQWVLDHPEASIFSVSQNDGFYYCQCPQCRAVDEYEGSHSGTLIRFVNAITERLTAEFPSISVETLAYQYSRIPPRHVRPHPSLIVRLCSIECCFSHPLTRCDARRRPHSTEYILTTKFREDLAGWGKICSRVYIWDYVVNFKNYVMPYANFHVLKPNMRFFVENNVKGVFEQGCGDMPYGELAELRAFLLSRLLWDKDVDTDALTNEFLAAFYGPAAGYVRAYIDLFREHVIKNDIHMTMNSNPNHHDFPDEVLTRAEQLLSAAETLAPDGPMRVRVRRLQLSIKYMRMSHIPKDDPGKRAAIEAFYDEALSLGVTTTREVWDLERIKDWILQFGMMKVWDKEDFIE